MSLMFIETKNDWRPVDLSSSTAFRLRGGAEPSLEPIELTASASLGDADAVISPLDQSGARWTLICKPSACKVNGDCVTMGLKTLSNRDELVLPGSDLRMLFSSEVVAAKSVYTGKTISCPRCHTDIVEGMTIVRCPHCSVIHHQHEDGDKALPCWTYSENCAVCQHPTALNAGYSWPPESW